jgi:excinuclease UvrABC nuclease subunit
MKVFSPEEYLDFIFNELVNNTHPQKILLTREWAAKFPSKPGCYIFRDKSKVIYVGETGNLKGRMQDILDTRRHVLRRTIGNRVFNSIEGWVKATERIKFIDTIEAMLDDHFRTNLTIAAMPISLGRKELEERLFKEYSPEYNQKGLRKIF